MNTDKAYAEFAKEYGLCNRVVFDAAYRMGRESQSELHNEIANAAKQGVNVTIYSGSDGSIAVDMMDRETHCGAFRKINPNDEAAMIEAIHELVKEVAG